MRESSVWKWLRDNLPAYLEVERFECTAPPGPGDCFITDTRSRISGWLELKYCDGTDRAFQAGRIPKLRATQPLFLRRMAARGVPSGILLRAGSSFFLWRSNGSHEWVSMVGGPDAIAGATRSWSGFPSVEEVWETLNPPL